MGSTRRTAILLTIGLFLLALFPNAGAAEVIQLGAMGRPSLGWKQVSPRPIGESLYAVAYGSGLWAAASDHHIFTSKNGRDWSEAATFTSRFAQEIRLVHTGDRFLVTNGMEGLSSTDGVRWEPAAGLNAKSLPAQAAGPAYLPVSKDATAGIAQLDGHYVLLERAGGVWRQKSGTDWEAVATLDGARWWGLAAGPAGLMAVGEGGAIARSADGRTWERVTRGPSHAWTSVAFGAGRFVAVGVFGTSLLYTSENGVDWSFQRVIMPPRAEFRVAYTAGRFWLYDEWGIRESSTDGLTWAATDDLLQRSKVIGTTGALLVKGPEGLMLSRAGEPLQALTAPKAPATITAGLVARDRYILGGDSGLLVVSTDGRSWSQTRVPDSCSIGGLVAGKTEYLAFCRFGGPIFRSTDGITWMAAPNSRAMRLFYAGDRYFALAENGRVLTSENGLTWDWRHQSPELTAVAYGQGRHVAVGAMGAVLVSDGPTPARLPWSEAPDPFGSTLVADATEGVGQQILITVTLRDRMGQPLAGRPVALFRDTAPSNSLVLETDSTGKAYFVLTRLDGGRAEIYRAADLASGTWLASQVTLTRRHCGTRFSDVTASHPECMVIEGVAARGHLTALTDGKFHGDLPLTRAELAKIAVLAAGRQPAQTRVPFTDIANHWAAGAGYIQAASYMDALSGDADGHFRPDDLATRAEWLQALVAISWLRPIAADHVQVHADVTPADWYAPYVRRALLQGYIGKNGLAPVFAPDQPLEADRPVTRLEVARSLTNLHYQVTGNLSYHSQSQP